MKTDSSRPPTGNASHGRGNGSSSSLGQHEQTRPQRVSSATYFDIANTILGSAGDLDEVLLCAARDGDYNRIEQLLYQRTDVILDIDYKDKRTGNTALIWAAKKGHTKIVQLLLRHGADPTLRNYEAQTALEVATGATKTMLLDSVSRAAECTHRLLLQAAWQGNIEVIRRLLLTNKMLDINCQNAEGLTPLMLVARDVQLFERLSAQLNKQYNPVEVAQELMKARANVHALDNDGRTCLHYAAQSRAGVAEKLVQTFLDGGSEPACLDKRQYTAIHWASHYGNTNVVTALLDGGSGVNSRGFAGLTPLHISAHNDHQRTAETLLQKGADVTLTDDRGLTPVDLAKTRKMKTTLKEAWTEATQSKPTPELAPVRNPSRNGTSITMKDTSPERKRGEVIFDGMASSVINTTQRFSQAARSRALQRAGKQLLQDIESGRYTPTPMMSRENTRLLGTIRNSPPVLPQISRGCPSPTPPPGRQSPESPPPGRKSSMGDELRRSLEDGRNMVGRTGSASLRGGRLSKTTPISTEQGDASSSFNTRRRAHRRTGSDPFSSPSISDVAATLDSIINRRGRSVSTGGDGNTPDSESCSSSQRMTPLRTPLDRETTMCVNIPTTIPEGNSPNSSTNTITFETGRVSRHSTTPMQVMPLPPNSNQILPPTPNFFNQRQYGAAEGALMKAMRDDESSSKEPSPRSDDEGIDNKVRIGVSNPMDLLRSRSLLKEEFILAESRPRDPFMHSSGSEPTSSSSSISTASSSPRDGNFGPHGLGRSAYRRSDPSLLTVTLRDQATASCRYSTNGRNRRSDPSVIRLLEQAGSSQTSDNKNGGSQDQTRSSVFLTQQGDFAGNVRSSNSAPKGTSVDGTTESTDHKLCTRQGAKFVNSASSVGGSKVSRSQSFNTSPQRCTQKNVQPDKISATDANSSALKRSQSIGNVPSEAASQSASKQHAAASTQSQGGEKGAPFSGKGRMVIVRDNFHEFDNVLMKCNTDLSKPPTLPAARDTASKPVSCSSDKPESAYIKENTLVTGGRSRHSSESQMSVSDVSVSAVNPADEHQPGAAGVEVNPVSLSSQKSSASVSMGSHVQSSNSQSSTTKTSHMTVVAPKLSTQNRSGDSAKVITVQAKANDSLRSKTGSANFVNPGKTDNGSAKVGTAGIMSKVEQNLKNVSDKSKWNSTGSAGGNTGDKSICNPKLDPQAVPKTSEAVSPSRPSVCTTAPSTSGSSQSLNSVTENSRSMKKSASADSLSKLGTSASGKKPSEAAGKEMGTSLGQKTLSASARDVTARLSGSGSTPRANHTPRASGASSSQQSSRSSSSSSVGKNISVKSVSRNQVSQPASQAKPPSSSSSAVTKSNAVSSPAASSAPSTAALVASASTTALAAATSKPAVASTTAKTSSASGTPKAAVTSNSVKTSSPSVTASKPAIASPQAKTSTPPVTAATVLAKAIQNFPPKAAASPRPAFPKGRLASSGNASSSSKQPISITSKSTSCVSSAQSPASTKAQGLSASVSSGTDGKPVTSAQSNTTSKPTTNLSKSVPSSVASKSGPAPLQNAFVTNKIATTSVSSDQKNAAETKSVSSVGVTNSYQKSGAEPKPASSAATPSQKNVSITKAATTTAHSSPPSPVTTMKPSQLMKSPSDTVLVDRTAGSAGSGKESEAESEAGIEPLVKITFGQISPRTQAAHPKKYEPPISTPVIVNPFEHLSVYNQTPRDKSPGQTVSASDFGYVVGRPTKDTPVSKGKTPVKGKPPKAVKKGKDAKRPASGASRQASAGRRRGGKSKGSESEEARPKSGKTGRVRSGRRRGKKAAEKEADKEAAQLAEMARKGDVALISGIGWHMATHCVDMSDVHAAERLHLDSSSDSDDVSEVESIDDAEHMNLHLDVNRGNISLSSPRFREIKIQQERSKASASVPNVDDDEFPPMNLDMTQHEGHMLPVTARVSSDPVREGDYENPVVLGDLDDMHKELLMRKLTPIPEMPSLTGGNVSEAIARFDRGLRDNQLSVMLDGTPRNPVLQCSSKDIVFKSNDAVTVMVETPSKTNAEAGSSDTRSKQAGSAEDALSKEDYAAPRRTQSMKETGSSERKGRRRERKFSESKKDEEDIDDAIEEILSATNTSMSSTLRSNSSTLKSGVHTLTEGDHKLLMKLKSHSNNSPFYAGQRSPEDDGSVTPVNESSNSDECLGPGTNPNLLKVMHAEKFNLGAKVKAMIDAGADKQKIKDMMNADEEAKQLIKVMNSFRHMELHAGGSHQREPLVRSESHRAAKVASAQDRIPLVRPSSAGASRAKGRFHELKKAGSGGLRSTGAEKKEGQDLNKSVGEEFGAQGGFADVAQALGGDIPIDVLANTAGSETVCSRLSGHRGSRRGSTCTTDSQEDETIQWKKGNILGKGAFGTVWCGLTSEGELIAVKQIELNTADQRKAEREYEKVQEEVELLKTLNHINIVGYLGTSFEDGTVSIFMQFVPGGSIASILARFGPLDEAVFRRYTRQIIQGVEYLHENDVIHRDIKGGNVMLMPNGIIKLIDFGCAKRLCINLSLSQTQILKSMKGTPYWMAPEVVNESGHGKKSDIWSIGCTVFEMATRKPPWAEMNPMAAIFAIGSDRPVPQLPDRFSPEAVSFVDKCLTRDQTKRPTASELLTDPFMAEKTSKK